ncbi:MAG TPA: lipopolysaccharide transport periplasmic protein LptA [Steroidobacteraceae bacterium]|nr:lipopolysaccharide transport periplasmic protein LptA [Steroidobacteraceae bacterium]
MSTAGMSLKLACFALALGSIGVSRAAGPTHAVGPTRIATPNGPVYFDASRLSVDYRNQHVVLENVTITQDDIRVTANRAVGNGTETNFANNRWVFTGNVHIRSELHGDLTSDSATVEFRDGLIQSALAVGRPAEFEQTESKTGVLASGHAESIEYDVAANTVRLTQDAWLKYGENVTTAPVLVYDIKAQQLVGVGAPRGDERVHITMLPKNSAKSAAKPARKRASEASSQSSSKPPATPPGKAGTGL